MNDQTREPLDPQGPPDPGEAIGLRPRVALAGYGILSMVFGATAFAGLVVPGLLGLSMSLPSPLGWTIQADDLWGVAGALAVVCGFLGVVQIIQEERRGFVLVVLGLLLGAWDLLTFLSRAGWFQQF